MGEIVNLQRAKKRLALQAAERLAAANRARHGRTGAQKANDARAEQRRRAALQANQREPDFVKRDRLCDDQ